MAVHLYMIFFFVETLVCIYLGLHLVYYPYHSTFLIIVVISVGLAPPPN